MVISKLSTSIIPNIRHVTMPLSKERLLLPSILKWVVEPLRDLNIYNIPYEHLGSIRIDEIKTHSFISKEVRLLSYVKDRNIVNIDKAEMDFSLYKKDLIERYMRIPRLQALYEKKLTKLRAFQNGKDIWKTDKY